MGTHVTRPTATRLIPNKTKYESSYLAILNLESNFKIRQYTPLARINDFKPFIDTYDRIRHRLELKYFLFAHVLNISHRAGHPPQKSKNSFWCWSPITQAIYTRIGSLKPFIDTNYRIQYRLELKYFLFAHFWTFLIEQVIHLRKVQLLHVLFQQHFVFLLIVKHFLPIKSLSSGDLTRWSNFEVLCLDLRGRMQTSPHFYGKKLAFTYLDV